MADVKISALPAATTPLAGTEVLPIVQSATTKQVSIANVTAGRAISASSLTLTTPLGVASGGTGLTSLTAGYIPYGNGTGAFSSVSTFVFDGTNLGLGTSSPQFKFDITGDIHIGSSTQGALRFGAIGNYTYAKVEYDDTNGNFNINNLRAYPIRFLTNNTEAMRITSAGDVGIGTSSPGAKLHVLGSEIRLETDNCFFAMYNTAGSRVGYFQGDTPSMTLAADAGNVSITAGGANIIKFNTNSSERMRIDSSGSLLVGLSSTLDSNSKAQFQNLGTSKNAYYAINNDASTNNSIVWNQATSGDNRLIAFITETSYTERGRIYYDRAAGQTKLAATSDARLKKDIVNAPSLLDAVNNIKVRQYAWKETGSINIGFIAQELIEVIPRAVSEGQEAEDGSIKSPWAVDGVTLIPYLTKAIQELAAKVSALEARI